MKEVSVEETDSPAVDATAAAVDVGRKTSQEELPVKTKEEAEVGVVSPEQPSESGGTHVSLTPPTSRRAATAVCRDTQDGGKVLIVQPSPLSEKKDKAALVFRLPPPPPPSDEVQPSSLTTTTMGDSYTEEKREKGGKQEQVTPPPPLPPPLPSSKDSTPPKYQLDLSPQGSQLDETILSNEYTNLDESDSDDIATTDFSLEDNLEPINVNPGMGQDKLGSAGEMSSDSESSTGALGAYDITGRSAEEDDPTSASEDEGGFEIPNKPPLGNFASSPPKSLQSTPTRSVQSTPPKLPDCSPPSLGSCSPPPSSRKSPGNSPPKPPRKSPPSLSPRPSPPSLRNNNNNNNNNNNDSVELELPPPPPGFEQPLDSEDTTEDAGIVLLSMRRNEEEAPVFVSESESTGTTTAVVNPKEPEKPEKSVPTTVSSPNKSPIPAKPKPPPFVPPKPATAAAADSKPVVHRPFRKLSTKAAEKELMDKLRVRQRKIEAFESRHPPQIKLPTEEPHQAPPIVQQATPLAPQATPTPSGDMQLQLQFLQQQMLQQQMLQIQQQFQQMQSMAYQPNPAPVATVMMPPQQAYPQTLYGMPMAPTAGMMLPGQHPMMSQPPLPQAIPPAGMIPAVATAQQAQFMTTPFLPGSGYSTTNTSHTTSGM